MWAVAAAGGSVRSAGPRTRAPVQQSTLASLQQMHRTLKILLRPCIDTSQGTPSCARRRRLGEISGSENARSSAASDSGEPAVQHDPWGCHDAPANVSNEQCVSVRSRCRTLLCRR